MAKYKIWIDDTTGCVMTDEPLRPVTANCSGCGLEMTAFVNRVTQGASCCGECAEVVREMANRVLLEIRMKAGSTNNG